MVRFFTGFVGFILILAVWTAGATLVARNRQDLAPKVREQLYPTPSQILAAARELPPSTIAANVGRSSERVLLGFLAAALLALPFGFAIGRSKLFAQALEPANDFLRYLPVAGFSSLAIFLLGTGDVSAVAVVFMGTVFHLVVATADVVRRVPQAYTDLGETIGLGKLQRLLRIVLPASSPAVFDNLRIAVGWAWSYVTLAEIMGTDSGLGHAIEVSRRFIRTDQVLFWILLVGGLGLLSDQLLRAISIRIFRWAA
jgi:NitT/TauT family transport system permease protein